MSEHTQTPGGSEAEVQLLEAVLGVVKEMERSQSTESDDEKMHQIERALDDSPASNV